MRLLVARVGRVAVTLDNTPMKEQSVVADAASGMPRRRASE